MLPFLLLLKLFPQSPFIKKWSVIFQDFITGLYMRPCDVLIAMSGSFLYTVKVGKKAGAKIIMERGSKHIIEQKKILEGIPSLKCTKPVPDINLKRELEGYGLADYISIPSNHVKDSFVMHNYPEGKLFVNPYGVSLDQFYYDSATNVEYDVIMVGGWSYQKGCDILVDACTKLRLKLLHVGSLVDLKFPQINNFTHVEPVDQKKLVNFYNQAKVFVLPSRQDGFGMVLSQALSCSLPVVCSKHTGGHDMGAITDLSEWIFEMKDYNVNELCDCIQQALNFRKTNPNRIINQEDLTNLTWTAYGSRYNDFINSLS